MTWELPGWNSSRESPHVADMSAKMCGETEHTNLDRAMQADLLTWRTAGVFSRSMKKGQRGTMGTHNRLAKWLFVILAMVGPTLAHDGSAAAGA